MIGLIAGIAAGVATYGYAKKRKTDTGTAAVAGGVTGIGTAGVVALAAPFWPLILVGGGIAYWVHNSKSKQKALPPAK